MIVCRRSMVSERICSVSRIEQSLDFSDQRIEGQAVSACAGRNLFSALALALREQLAHDPGSRARVAPPVVIEARGQPFVQNRLQLPRAEVSRRIVAGDDIDEIVGSFVLESGGLA